MSSQAIASMHAVNSPHLVQGNMSVEAYAADFRSVNSRITVGSPTDTSTLAGYFLNGLKKHIVAALTVTISLPTMQNSDLLIGCQACFVCQAGALGKCCNAHASSGGYGPDRADRKGKGRGRGGSHNRGGYQKDSVQPGAGRGGNAVTLALCLQAMLVGLHLP